jgi:hypothetical protein
VQLPRLDVRVRGRGFFERLCRISHGSKSTPRRSAGSLLNERGELVGQARPAPFARGAGSPCRSTRRFQT